jgi:uncharacterized membrane protein
MTALPHSDHSKNGFQLDRLGAFSDGVIAIAITILVLGLEVPSVHDVTKSGLGDYLRESIHPAMGFVISFVMIGTFWLEHYAIFHFLTHATRPLVALNGLFLLCVTFLPFPTGLLGVYRHDELAMVLYGIAQLLCGLSLSAIWLYASHDWRLVNPKTSPIVVRSMTRRLLIAPGLSLAAIGCSFISIPLSKVIFLSIPIFYMTHRIVDAGWQEATLDDSN